MSKVALVTGAAVGIGRACAIRLARDGVAVGVLDLDVEKCELVVAEIEKNGGRAIALKANVAVRSEVVAAVDLLRSSFGEITILVNNAGVVSFVPFEELTDAEWDRMFEVNTKGTFIVTQVVLPDMKKKEWGRVINISSSSAQTGSFEQVHYSGSKGAVMAMTKSLAQALGPYGVTVNNIPPGAVMNTEMSEAHKHRFPIKMDDLMKAIPVGRTGIPEDIANACAWLASEDSGYVSGQTIGINGGRIVS